MQAFNRPTSFSLSAELLTVLAEVPGVTFEHIPPTLARAVSDLSRHFTQDRSSLRGHYLEDRLVADAYLAYFLPVNVGKFQILLDELPDACGDGAETVSVLDVGAGPGTGALAVLDWLCRRRRSERRSVTVIAVDQSPSVLRDATRLWECYRRVCAVADAHLSPCLGNVETMAKGPLGARMKHGAPYDLILLGNCLNELFCAAVDPPAERASMTASLMTLLKSNGTLMIIEPALRKSARELHQMRDLLLRQQAATVYSPCLHEFDCPALVRPDDWCHEERPWVPPPTIQAIDHAVGFIKDALKFSYLLLRKDGRTIVKRQPDVFRVVSELREFKGEKRAWLCNELGRPEVGRLDRMASPQNAAVDAWHRGAIVQIERIDHRERDGKRSALGRIQDDAAVQIIRSI